MMNKTKRVRKNTPKATFSNINKFLYKMFNRRKNIKSYSNKFQYIEHFSWENWYSILSEMATFATDRVNIKILKYLVCYWFASHPEVPDQSGVDTHCTVVHETLEEMAAHLIKTCINRQWNWTNWCLVAFIRKSYTCIIRVSLL